LKRPANKWFEVLESAVKDPLFVTKLHFFKCISDAIKPFFCRYLTNVPMMPFMEEDLVNLLQSLLNRFIRKDHVASLSTSSQLVNVDVTDKALQVQAQNVDIGFAARLALNLVNVNERKKVEFFFACRDFLSVMCEKLLKRSPLRFAIVCNASCLSPQLMAEDQDLGARKMRNLLESFLKVRKVSASFCEQASKEYDVFCRTVVLRQLQQFKDFRPIKDRVDVFLSAFLHGCDTYCHLYQVRITVIQYVHMSLNISFISDSEDSVLLLYRAG
jgi:hypothetical protein